MYVLTSGHLASWGKDTSSAEDFLPKLFVQSSQSIACRAKDIFSLPQGISLTSHDVDFVGEHWSQPTDGRVTSPPKIWSWGYSNQQSLGSLLLAGMKSIHTDRVVSPFLEGKRNPSFEHGHYECGKFPFWWKWAIRTILVRITPAVLLRKRTFVAIWWECQALQFSRDSEGRAWWVSQDLGMSLLL